MYAAAVRLLDEGRAAPADAFKAYELFVEAAARGHVEAGYEAAQSARLGRGTERNLKLAYAMYRVAADKGHVQAAFSAAALTAQEGGDMVAAVKLYRQAADASHAGAAHNLGVLYARGQGTERDALAAKECFEKSFALGFTGAAGSLAVLFLVGGPGLPSNPVEALAWALVGQRSGPGGPCAKVAEEASKLVGEAGRGEARRLAAERVPTM